ncbi:hypothetical protein H5410_045995 [Solanum commersonii]|uniref:Uncharacterized protein n=1 Tax=Solanum commersonii TaxID=4109 RepID=A0A9J5XB28_SOLCO|nr:hypothetical protein H5410_045995 [Solanum commersonii]
MAGSKQSRKGEASKSSNAWEAVQKFGKKAVERYGWEWFAYQQEAQYMGDEFVNERFCYGGLITHFLRAEGVKEEVVDRTVAYHPDLTGKLVAVTCTKVLDTSHGHVLSAQVRQARDDSVMARMFGMAELQLRIGGRPITDAEIDTMAERYPLTESAAFLCRTGPTFLEPLDDDEPTADEAMDDEEDDVVDEEPNVKGSHKWKRAID